jgi:uncharacterized membrane protein
LELHSSSSITIAINLSGNAAGNAVLDVNNSLHFFHAGGNAANPNGFELTALPATGVPEPSTIITAALALTGRSSCPALLQERRQPLQIRRKAT